MTVEGLELPVKSPEDVVLEKLASADRFPDERELDLQDAVGILYKQGEAFDTRYARDRCASLGVCEVLETLLERIPDDVHGGGASPS